jgi:hypothetical protein
LKRKLLVRWRKIVLDTIPQSSGVQRFASGLLGWLLSGGRVHAEPAHRNHQTTQIGSDPTSNQHACFPLDQGLEFSLTTANFDQASVTNA